MEDPAARKARLKRMREEANATEAAEKAVEEPKLKFRLGIYAAQFLGAPCRHLAGPGRQAASPLAPQGTTTASNPLCRELSRGEA